MRTLLAVLLFVTAASSAEVGFLLGSATVNGKPVELGMAVHAGDTVRTDAESIVEILTDDGVSIRIKEKSQLVVEALKEKKAKSLWNLLGGAVQVIAPNPVDLQLRGPIATAAIRGTIFYARADERGDYFCTCNGTVAYLVSGKEEKAVSARHHQGILVLKDGTITDAGMEDHTDTDIFDQLYNMGLKKK